MTDKERTRSLSDAQIAEFIQQGFVRIENAFPRELAEQGRAIMWRDLPCREDDPSTWTRPVVRLPGYGQEPFRQAINTPVLQTALDQIVGEGRWRPRRDIGTFPVRFPQRHRGSTPRLMAQPSLALAEPYRLERADGDYSPVEIAMRQALGKKHAG